MGVVTFVKVRMSIRRARRDARPDDSEHAAPPSPVRVEEDGGVRSARTRLGRRR